MAGPSSPLAIAADGIAEALQNFFNAAGNNVLVAVDTPLATNEKAKGANNSHFVNLFFYRVGPSGFHAAQTNHDPLFLRLQCLVTPFPGKFDNAANAEPHPDLRILGEAIRFFNNQQLFPQPLKNPGAEGTAYRLECTLQHPNMEEINHIWTTQGSDLAYRLSAVYEFSLIPMDPLKRVAPAPPVRAATLDVRPSAVPPDATTFGAEIRGIPIKGEDGNPPPTRWLPIVMLRDGPRLTNIASVAPAANAVDLALAGLPGELAAIDLDFQKADGTPAGASARSFKTIAAALLDDEAAALSLPLNKPNDTARLTIRTRPGKVVGGNNTVEANAPFTHTLTVSFDGAHP
ncbi:hypothetical protein ACVME8_010790 [Bradyrhizobium diazoefficiens]